MNTQDKLNYDDALERRIDEAISLGDLVEMNVLVRRRRPVKVGLMEAELAHASGMDIDSVIEAAIMAIRDHSQHHSGEIF